MESINVWVPQTLLAQIDEGRREQGYTSKSTFLRDVLRDPVNPSVTFSEEALDHFPSCWVVIPWRETIKYTKK